MKDYDIHLMTMASSGLCSAGYAQPSHSRAGGEPLWLLQRRAEELAELRAAQRLVELAPEGKP